MKLTTDLLKSIILEQMKEYDLPGIDDTPKEISDKEAEEVDEEGEVADTKRKLREKFYFLYQNISKAKGLDKKELALFDNLLDTALKAMQDGSALPTLKLALAKLEK
jgi:hypothetical protein